VRCAFLRIRLKDAWFGLWLVRVGFSPLCGRDQKKPRVPSDGEIIPCRVRFDESR